MSTFLATKALLEEGTPKKEIARRLSINVRTVRAWAKRIAEGRGHERAPASGGGLLAPFEYLIAEMVGRDMSAVQIHRELSAREDFSASYVTVRRRVRALRHKHPEVYCRMRYAPGELGQVDFGDVGRFEVAGQTRRAFLFVLTLCHSRLAYYELVLDQRVPTFLGALRRAFEFFGGAPKSLRPDNLKAAVLLDGLGQRYYQEDFYRFCRHYGTLPDAARPHTPTDKGRVERDIRYAKGSFFRGREPESLAAAREALRAWQDEVANVRIHGTTGKRPIDVFEEDRSALVALPAEPYEICEWALRRVRKDCHVVLEGNRYSVPYVHVGGRVLLRLSEREVVAFADGAQVARHERAEGQNLDVTDPSHYPAEKRIATQEIHRRRVSRIRGCGENAMRYLRRIRASRYVHASQLAHLARLVDAHGEAAFEKACARALYFGALQGAKSLERILDRGLHEHELPTTGSRPKDEGERDFGRPLEEYDALVAERRLA